MNEMNWGECGEMRWIYDDELTHFDVEQVGESVHVVDAIGILIPQLVEQSQSLVYVWNQKRSQRAVRPAAAPRQRVSWRGAKPTSDVVIRDGNLWNDVGALRKAGLNEVLVFLQRFFDHLQLRVHVGHEEVFNPAVWQGQRLQLGTKERHTHQKKNVLNYFLLLLYFCAWIARLWYNKPQILLASEEATVFFSVPFMTEFKFRNAEAFWLN